MKERTYPFVRPLFTALYKALSFLTPFLGLFLLWVLIDALHPLPNYLAPRPLEFLIAFGEPTLKHAATETLIASCLGIALSSVAGFSLAAMIHQCNALYRWVYPIAIFFQVVPIIAIAPLLIIWFGYGLPSVIVSSWIVGFFPVLVNSFSGFRNIPEEHYFLFHLHGASRWDIFWKLELPSALPSLMNGVRIAAGACVIGAIVGEFMSGGGLGGIISASRQEMNLGLSYAAILCSTLLGYGLFEAVAFIERWIRK